MISTRVCTIIPFSEPCSARDKKLVNYRSGGTAELVVARRQTNSGDIFAQVIEDSRPSKNQSTLSMNLKVTR
jgi:hypothetical protein